MTERQANDRRNWKAMLFPYDEVFPDGSGECLYCLTYKQAKLLRGLLEPIGWKTRWWSDETETEIDKDTIEEFRDDIIGRLMMGCGCDEGILFQYSTDGILQQSEDNGTTWQDVPEKDPRNNSPIFPKPPTADNDKCTYADSAVKLIKEQVGDQLTDDMGRYTLSQLISDWVNTVINTSNILDALITVITNQIFALVIATLRPALTDDVYNKLRCAIEVNMSNNFDFNDTQWTAVRTKITTDISGIAGAFLEHLVYLLGKGGLTNLVRAGAGASDADCSACVPDCSIDNWSCSLWNVGTYYPAGSIGTIGLELSRDATSITIQSQDRGDGQQVIALTTSDGSICCGFTAEPVGAASPSTLNFFNYCGVNADYSAMVEDNTAPFTNPFTQCYLQMSPGSWVVKFAITP